MYNVGACNTCIQFAIGLLDTNGQGLGFFVVVYFISSIIVFHVSTDLLLTINIRRVRLIHIHIGLALFVNAKQNALYELWYFACVQSTSKPIDNMQIKDEHLLRK